MASRRSEEPSPSRTKRSSSSEWSGSSIRMALSSANAVMASSNGIPCRRRLAAAFRVSHSKRSPHTRGVYVYCSYESSLPRGANNHMSAELGSGGERCELGLEFTLGHCELSSWQPLLSSILVRTET